MAGTLHYDALDRSLSDLALMHELRMGWKHNSSQMPKMPLSGNNGGVAPLSSAGLLPRLGLWGKMVSDATFSLEMKKTLCCLLVGWCSIVHAQKLATTPAFEVSTVRPSSQDAQESNLNLGPDGIRSSNLPVIFLLKFAFNLNAGSNDQIVGAPPWLSSLPFDIHAKVGEETAARLADMPTDERIAATRNMIRALLADRFGLRVHYESRKLSVLALTVTKGGSKLTPTNDKPASETQGADAWTGLHNPGAGQTEGRDVPVALLVNALSSKPEIDGRLVVDETGLTGNTASNSFGRRKTRTRRRVRRVQEALRFLLLFKSS